MTAAVSDGLTEGQTRRVEVFEDADHVGRCTRATSVRDGFARETVQGRAVGCSGAFHIVDQRDSHAEYLCGRGRIGELTGYGLLQSRIAHYRRFDVNGLCGSRTGQIRIVHQHLTSQCVVARVLTGR